VVLGAELSYRLTVEAVNDYHGLGIPCASRHG
jgi:hypothetical protein